jgi:surface antigen
MRRAGGCIVAAFMLAGCGVPEMVSSTTQSALAPATSIAQSASSTVTQSVAAVSRSASITGTQAAQAFSNSSANMANALRTTTQTVGTAARVSTVSPPPLTADQKAAIEKAKTAGQQDLPILPDETLAKLTPDQRGMQNAAQIAALTAPIGEEIFWTDGDRTGSAVAEEEHTLGETVCRNFEQSVTIDGTPKEAHAIACKDGDSGHWALAF